jgi:hypothetical protein
MVNSYWQITDMTVISLYVGWRNGAELRSFQAVSLPNILERLTGILTKNAIWWKIRSSNSKTTATLPPDMRRKLSISGPIQSCVAQLEKMADGDLHTPSLHVKSKDETVQLAKALKTILSRLNDVAQGN